MVAWDQDYTAGDFAPYNLKVGSTTTTITVRKRHLPFQGNAIGRDEIDNSTFACISDSTTTNVANAGKSAPLKFSVEKYQGDGWSGYILREVESKRVLAVSGHWIRLKPEEEVDDDEDKAIQFERYESHRNDEHTRGEYAWLMWFRSQSSCIRIDDDGDLNTKKSGRMGCFTFREAGKKRGRTDDEDDDEGEPDFEHDDDETIKRKMRKMERRWAGKEEDDDDDGDQVARFADEDEGEGEEDGGEDRELPQDDEDEEAEKGEEGGEEEEEEEDEEEEK